MRLLRVPIAFLVVGWAPVAGYFLGRRRGRKAMIRNTGTRLAAAGNPPSTPWHEGERTRFDRDRGKEPVPARK